MAGTRRSTRQMASTAPKYTGDSSLSAEEDSPARNGIKSTRRKRTRKEQDEDIADDSPPALKKAAIRKTKTSKSSDLDAPKTKTIPPPAPSSDSNRTANGSQEVFWLLKAEPLPRYENGVNVAFSIDDLAACTVPEPWSGVRNPQARNNMQAMRKGDLALFYHSNAKPSGAVGVLRVVDEATVDESAFDPKDPYYDAKSDKAKPKWYCVGVEFVSKFDDVVDLARIKSHAQNGGPLKDMQLVTNSRLSVSRVRREEWDFILGLAGQKKGSDDEHKVDKEQA